MNAKAELRVGLHVSIAGGIDKAVERTASLGCRTFQIFSRSPRGGKPRPLSKEELHNFKDLRDKYDISPVAVHVPYFFNLAAPDDKFFNAAKEILTVDLARAAQIGAEYLVLHGGSHKGTGVEKALNRLVEGLNSVLADYLGDTMILLENQAGSGSEIVSRFEEINFVLINVKHAMGVCFDTCHGFAAGYDISNETSVKAVFEQFDKIIGLEKLKLIHCNDSKFPLGSKKDRHEHIGLGFIGEEGFESIVNHDYVRTLPFILETPRDADNDDILNLKKIVALYNL